MSTIYQRAAQRREHEAAKRAERDRATQLAETAAAHIPTGETTHWSDRALCAALGPAAWEAEHIRIQARICHHCPVAADCHTYAEATHATGRIIYAGRLWSDGRPLATLSTVGRPSKDTDQ